MNTIKEYEPVVEQLKDIDIAMLLLNAGWIKYA
jgi:hypothetical protein